MVSAEKIVPGEAVRLSDLVVRITAPNPGMMTGPGTNSYVVGREQLAVIDPGPDIESHVAALASAAGSRLRWILCTHTHRDHSPAAQRLKAVTGAEMLGFAPVPQDGRQDSDFRPDRPLADGDVLETGEFRLRALHTPGHASNHLCYLLEERRMLFTGDHVMQGSTVVISPPDGDMALYLRSLERLLTLKIDALAPGHGRVIPDPATEVRRLITHRLGRERKVLDAVTARGEATLDELVPVVYDDVPAKLHPVASRSLHAHLIKLAGDGLVRHEAGHWSRAAS